jgi:hypothetical protein
LAFFLIIFGDFLMPINKDIPVERASPDLVWACRKIVNAYGSICYGKITLIVKKGRISRCITEHSESSPGENEDFSEISS